MNRRDVIIISVLVNAGLLAVLFMTAVKSDSDSISSNVEIQQVAVAEPQQTQEQALVLQEAPQSVSLDEVDHVLKEYLPELPLEVAADQNEVLPELLEEVVKPAPEAVKVAKETIVEVTVKSGDALEKIARANQTTVEAIRKANNLSNDKLKIGQVLKVPVGTSKPKSKPQPTKVESQVAAGDEVYYTIKNGDNLWKIAKQFKAKSEDLLKWNNLTEEKAKNLKPGEKIRVK